LPPGKQYDEQFDTIVIGGGAAGIVAAISAARATQRVLICEKTAFLGKKLLATGNGRCNLLNDDLDETHFNTEARRLVKSVFAKFGRKEIADLFTSLGLSLYTDEGRVFPRTNQAASVLKVLEMELKHLGVPVKLEFDCVSVLPAKSGFTVTSRSGDKLQGRRVIITGGGKTYPAFGSDGGAYAIVSRLGHSLVEPVPVGVPLVVKDNLCQLLQGQRIAATARSVINAEPGREVSGELLFTKYGLSGTCALDVSEEISIALNRRKRTQVFITVDLVPFMDLEALRRELERRRARGLAPGDMLCGILPNKFGEAFKELFERDSADAAAGALKSRLFRIADTRGWNEAEFTAGGIECAEVEIGTLESKIKQGVFFAGEVLDVNGQRGGYNLAWAWASGWVAGAGE
jgi:hypothetical protein